MRSRDLAGRIPPAWTGDVQSGGYKERCGMSFTVYNLVYLIICIVEALIACQYFEGIRAYEDSGKIRSAAFVFGYGMIYLLHFLSDNIWIGLLIFFVLNFLLGYFIYRIPLRSAAIYTGVMTAVLIASEWMINGIMNSMFIMSGESQKTLGYITLSTVLGRMIYLIVMEIFIRIRSTVRDDRENRISGMVPIYTASALSCLSVFVLAYVEIKQLVTGTLQWLVICGALAILLSNTLIYWNSIQSRRIYREYTDAQVRLERENANVTYYRMLAERSEEQKILIHDMRKHLNQLSGLIHMQDYGKASAYVSELLETPALQPTVRVCDNEMASLILTRYQEKCRQENIRFYPDVRSKCLDYLSLRELTALLSNLLDNALEAASGAPDAYIDLRIMRKTKTQVVIRMDNSCIRPPRRSQNGALQTHKQDAGKHGFGIKSIEGVLKKYNGAMETRYDTEKQIFHTIIFMSARDSAKPDGEVRK